MIFPQIFDSINTGLVILEKDFRVYHWNRWLELNSGIQRQAIKGRTIFEFFPDLDTPGFIAKANSVIKFGNYCYFSQKLHKYLLKLENRNPLDSDFKYMQQSCTMGPLRGEDSNIDLVFLTVQDVTDNVRMELILNEQATFVKNNPAPVLRINRKGEIIFANPTTNLLLGKDPVGRQLSEIFPSYRYSQRDVKKGIEIYQFESYIHDKAFLFSIREDALTDSFYVYGSDISDLKAAEKSLKNAYDALEDKIEERTRELNLLQKLNNAMNAATALDKVLKMTTDGISELFNYAACNIYLFDKNRDDLVLSAYTLDMKILSKVEELTGLKVQGMKVPLHEGSRLREIVYSKKTQLTNDMTGVYEDLTTNKAIRQHAGTIANMFGFRTAVRVPLIAMGEVVGIIGAARKEDITPNDVEVLERFASQVAMIIRKAQAEDAIRDSELKYRTLFENSTDGISIYERYENGKRKLIECNPSYVRMSGRGKEELLAAEDIRTLQKSGNPEYDTAAIQQKIANGHPYWGTFSWRRPDGKENYIEYEAVPLKMVGKTCIYVIDRDITARKKAEEALKESETRYRMLAENVADLIWTTDLKLKMTYITPSINEMFGYHHNEAMSLPLRRFLTRNSYQKCMRLYREQIEAEKAQDTDRDRTLVVELEMVRKDGSVFWTESKLTFLRDDDGIPIGIIGISRNIDALKKSDEEIRQLNVGLEQKVESRTSELNKALKDTEQARGRIDAIIKSVADGLIVTDIYNNIVLMNRAAEELLDVRLSEVMGQPFSYAVKEETLRDMVSRTKKKNTTYEYDFEMPGIEPVHPLIMRARTSVIHNRQGEQSGAVTIIHDVTHEREVDRMKTEFISTAAHELRTPLTSIMGFSEILLTRDNIKLKERKRYLSHINKQSVNLKEIIDDLLDISRIESGRGFSLVKSHWYFDECVEEVAPYFIEHSSEKTFHLNLPKERVRVYADRDKIGQVLKNLLSNAVKYSPAGGAITIKGKPVNGSFEVSVVDSGIGMTPDQLGHMFEKFYRADASNSAAEGTGLGMTIVKYIVEAHGGTVQVDSKYGEGTTVKFSVPIKEGEDEENTDS